MSNILLGHTNRIDAATLSNGAWTVGLPLNNLKDGDIDKVARSNGMVVTATRFAIDLGAPFSLRAIALVNHNISANGSTWLVKAGTAAPDAVNVFASGQVLTSGAMNCRQLTFQGDTPADWGVQYNLLYAFGAVTARYVTVDITDTANAAGYVQIGRVFVGGAYQPAYNPAFGLRDGRMELSTSGRSESGKNYWTRRARPRYVEFELPRVSLAEANLLHELDGSLGLTEEVLYVPDPADMALSQRFGFLGTMRDLTPLEYPFANNRAKGYRIEQKL